MEKVRLFQKLLEYLYALTPATRKFVKEHFSVIDENWLEVYFRRYYEDELNFVLDLNEFDLPKLISGICDNWGILKSFFGKQKFSDKNFHLLKKIKSIRNKVAHLNEKHYSTIETYENDIASLEKFANFLGTTLEDCRKAMYDEENSEIKKIIIQTIEDPAIEAEENLPPDIIRKIKETKSFLQNTETAKEIVDFFEDALENSTIGKEIARTLNEHGLLAFEDIAEQIKNKYYGFVR